MDSLEFLALLNKQRQNIRRVNGMGQTLKYAYNQMSEDERTLLDGAPLFHESGYGSVSEYMGSITLPVEEVKDA